MLQTLRSWLARPYGIITGCALCSGIAVGTIEDARHWAADRLGALLFPAAAGPSACLEDYFATATARDPGSYLIILTDLVNDADSTQTRLVDRTLRRLYGEDVGGAIQLEGIPCTIYSTTGNAATRREAARQTARDIADRAQADVVIWGEVVAAGAEIELSMTHPDDSSRHGYTIAQSTLSANFGADIGALVAAKMLTLVDLSVADYGVLQLDRMNRVLTLTDPLLATPPTQMTAQNLADLQRARGTALWLIGDQTGDLTRLAAARTAFEAALAGYTDPDDRTAMQSSLGDTLQLLGRGDPTPDTLRAAVAAYTAALAGISQTDDPVNWAAVHNNLGGALLALNERDGATATLTAALAAFDTALAASPRAASPLDWALVQNNRGNALLRLGERQTDTKALRQAVTAYRAALEERDRTRVPLMWAGTQNNLGNALQLLGQRGTGTADLLASVAAYQAALTVRTRDALPQDWAVTQANLASTLSVLDQREPDGGWLEQAIAAYRAALEKTDRTATPQVWANAQDNLGNVLLDLVARGAGAKPLAEAEAAFAAALTVRTRADLPIDWAVTQTGLARVDLAWFDATGDAARLTAARAKVALARDVFVGAGYDRHTAYTAHLLSQIAARARQ